MRPTNPTSTLGRTLQIPIRRTRLRDRGLASSPISNGQYGRQLQQRLLSNRWSNETRVKSISLTSLKTQSRCLSLPTEPISTASTSSTSSSSWKPLLAHPSLKKIVSLDGKTRIHCDSKVDGLVTAIEVACEASKKRYGLGAEKNIGIITMEGSLDRDFFSLIDESHRPQTGKPHLKGMVSAPTPSVRFQRRNGGHQFPFPEVKRKNGAWLVEPPLGMKKEFSKRRKFSRLGDIFDLQKRLMDSDAKRYRDYFEEIIGNMVAQGRRFGAVVLEPIMVGDYAKSFVDPLFQYMLVQIVRENPQLFASSHSTANSDSQSWKGLPIIVTETTGSGQLLGPFDFESLLQVQPDLTLVRNGWKSSLCTLVVHESFSGDLPITKADAITTQLQTPQTKSLATTEETCVALKKGWEHETLGIEGLAAPDRGIWSVWSNNFVTQMAESPNVRDTMALGFVLSLTLRIERPGLAGLLEEEALLLKEKLYNFAKMGLFDFRVSGQVLTLWPTMPIGLEDMRNMEMLLVRELIGEDVALRDYEGDGLYVE